MRNFTQNIDFRFLIAGVVVSLITVTLVLTLMFLREETSNTGLEVQIYESGAGYGYRILLEEDILIQQDYIPALENHQPFCDREQAKRVAFFVLKKLMHGSNPGVSFSELKALEIEVYCVEKK